MYDFFWMIKSLNTMKKLFKSACYKDVTVWKISEP